VRFLHPASQGSRALLARASVLTTAAFLLGAMLSPATATQPSSKTYTDSASPSGTDSPVSVGETVAATFSIANTNTQQTLGSANITAPAGVTINPDPTTIAIYACFTSLPKPTSPPPPCSSTTDVNFAGTASVDFTNTIIQLRNLNLAEPTSSANGTVYEVVTVTFNMTVGCNATSGQWSTLNAVKQSNNWNGPPGNNYTNAGTDPSLVVSGGSCHLAFWTQPASTVKGTGITTTSFDTSNPQVGSPIEVLAYGGDPSTPASWVPMPGVSVSIAYLNADLLTAKPVALATTTTGSDGIASFSGLTITTSGDYVLVASSPVIPPPTGPDPSISGYDSSANPPVNRSFAITDTYCSLASSSCGTTQLSYSNTITTITTSGTSGYVAAGITANYAGGCQGYSAYSGAIVTAIVTTGTQSFVTLDLEKVLSGKIGVSSFEVCFESDASFAGLYGTVPAYTFGVLADCTNPNTYDNAPCVVSRNRSTVAKSDVLITVALPLNGDPKLFS
jgi:hypothetical protein